MSDTSRNKIAGQFERFSPPQEIFIWLPTASPPSSARTTAGTGRAIDADQGSLPSGDGGQKFR